jgi:predicted nucleic-acid-binding protein
MQIVDTNIMLRYILSDNEEQATQAEQIIDNNHIHLPIEVLCEVVYVLEKVYNADREDIATQLSDIINSENITVPYQEAVLLGLQHYDKDKLDFVDGILAGYSEAENATVHTFDKKLRKIIDNQ